MLRLMNSVILPMQRSICVIKYIRNVQISGIQCRMYSKQFDVQQWAETLDEAQQKRIRFIQNELELKRIEEKYVPKLEQLSKFDYEHMLNLSQNQRQKYYRYLFKAYNSNSADLKKREIRREMSEFQKAPEIENENQHIEYGLGKGALIPKIYNRTIDKWKNSRALWRVALNDPKIIFDCSFSSGMTYRENQEAAKQLTLCFGLNRSHRLPYVLHYCGMNFGSLLWKNIERHIPTITKKPLPLKIHEEDVLDVFPHEKIVFLTPDSPNVLTEYNPDDHYVISAIVDRGDKIPLTLAKAKKYEMRTARLPLESYRKCRIHKALTLDQVLQVMLEIKMNGDWNQAFRFVAGRKFY